MEDKKMQDANLTPAQVRRRIAEALGWRCIAVKDQTTTICKPPNRGTVSLPPGSHVMFNPQGEPLWTEGNHVNGDHAWEYALRFLIPDWPTDACASLALCLEIAFERDRYLIPDKIDETFYKAEFRTTAYKASGDPVWQLREGLVAYGGTPAEALARLALAALEGGESPPSR